MTTVGGVSNTQTQTGGSAAPPQAEVGSEYNSFIKLLVAQLRNQDPMQPLDSTQFVEQLATFSGLEQQVQSNSALSSIATMMNDLTGLMAGQWLGETVSFEASQIPFSGDVINFKANLPPGTASSILTIKDSAGQTVWSETLDPDTRIHSWDGMTASGARAPEGDLYQYSIDTYDTESVHLSTISPRVVTTVTSIASEDGAILVNTAAGLSANLGSVQKEDRIG